MDDNVIQFPKESIRYPGVKAFKQEYNRAEEEGSLSLGHALTMSDLFSAAIVEMFSGQGFDTRDPEKIKDLALEAHISLD